MYHDATRRGARPCSTQVDVYPLWLCPTRRTMRSIARRCDGQNTSLKFESVPNYLYYTNLSAQRRALLVCFVAMLLRRFRASSRLKRRKGTELRTENQNWPCTRNFFGTYWYRLVNNCSIMQNAWYVGTVPAVPDRQGLHPTLIH